MESLQLKAIEKQFKEHNKNSTKTSIFSVKQTSITIQEGEFFSLLGPSGCGKTTLLKLVAGLLAPDAGDVFLNDKKITPVVPEERGFSMVFQEALLFPHMTVEENVAFGLKMKGIRKRKRMEKARETLVSVGLEGFGKRYPSVLSGGQKQRVSLARAIAPEPRLLLMDEPFSALDPGLREEMRELVARMHKEHGVTILFVTHDREEAFQLSDRIGIMENGEILQLGNPRDLYEKPGHPHVALFLGAKNVLSGKLQQGMFVSEDFQVPLPRINHTTDGRGWLVIRPETFMIEKEQQSNKIEETTVFKGVIKEQSFRQGFYYMKVQTGSKVLDVVLNAGLCFDLKQGDVLLLRISPDKLHFIPQTEQIRTFLHKED
ncbi:ABC transporter ATP-binding protein [Halobacillus naozhouensis]|uniref:ABC transporter ATP-binding protein n=1 Tax=Halobacillus naozhouensis TaxID=554880 RepID=A0ABY8J147_9BACI|nr:ABC transporter ATP-binding protein [Halobacillus naozhouensis]WFT74495.1 ABC transporter ATP-binding protein [Halobacillus naozhouensis]